MSSSRSSRSTASNTSASRATPGVLTADDLVGVVVHTDLRPTGSFECNGAKNALHEAAVWSFRGNACDIPTDCPTRERAGWTGDWQLYVPSATHPSVVAGFFTIGIATSRPPSGTAASYPTCSHVPRRAEGFLEKLNGSAGWGDAAVLVPWEIYLEYGDTRLLEEQWPSMVAWLGFVERTADEERHTSRVEARPEGSAREVPLGRRLPLGRMARAGGGPL